jgi:sulfite exporter TauE/SafE
MESIWLGFVLGFMGSMHCIGMCGPIVLALPQSDIGRLRLALGRLSYNFGRTITYTAMGLIAGVAGFSLNALSSQQTISIVMGVIIILMAILPSKLVKDKLPFLNGIQLPPALKRLFSAQIQKGTNGAMFIIGLINGLLPCGLVYFALAGALAQGSTVFGTLFMFLFGLGTIPALFALSMLGSFTGARVKSWFNRMIPVFAVIMGLLFILRGLSLGIPLLSPTGH